MKLFLSILDHVDIVTLTDGKRYNLEKLDQMDLMFSIMIMARAHDENEIKSRRIADAKARSRKDIGLRKMTKTGPFWLTLSDDRTKWNLQDDKVKTVQKMYQLSLDGNGMYRIMTYLNENKILSATGKRWGLSSVQKVLSDKQVLGHLQPTQYGKAVGDVITDYYPQVISEQDYYAVQALKAKRHQGSSGPTGKEFTNLFKGIARCHCGETMHLKNNGPKYKYLVCSAAKRGNSTCTYKSYKYAETETFLLKLLSVIDYTKLSGDNSHELTAKFGKLEESIKEVGGMVDMLTKGLGKATSEAAMDHIVTQLDQRAEEHKQLLLDREGVQAELVHASSTDATKAFNELNSITLEDRTKLNSFLRQHLDQIEFEGNNVLVHLKAKSFIVRANLNTVVTPESLAPLYDQKGLDNVNFTFDMDEQIMIY